MCIYIYIYIYTCACAIFTIKLLAASFLSTLLKQARNTINKSGFVCLLSNMSNPIRVNSECGQDMPKNCHATSLFGPKLRKNAVLDASAETQNVIDKS